MLTSNNVKKLPDAYKKTQDSNNAKLLCLNECSVSNLLDVVSDINNSLDFYEAYGKTLDLYGDIYGQQRGGLNDTKYRYLILSKIAVNSSGVDHESIMENVVKMLGCQYSDIAFVENPLNRDATIRITAIPYAVLSHAGFSTRQAVEMLARLFPICVNIEANEFQGTFEFAATATEYDEGKGFGNIEQTIGGTLGLLYGEDDETPLPIM